VRACGLEAGTRDACLAFVGCFLVFWHTILYPHHTTWLRIRYFPPRTTERTRGVGAAADYYPMGKRGAQDPIAENHLGPYWRKRLLLLSNSSFCYQISYSVYSSILCTLRVRLLYSIVRYIVAYSTYFRCILWYSMYSAEGECTPMYLGVLCCVSGVHVLYTYSECTPLVL
jgi:hypothetical protein